MNCTGKLFVRHGLTFGTAGGLQKCENCFQVFQSEALVVEHHFNSRQKESRRKEKTVRTERMNGLPEVFGAPQTPFSRLQAHYGCPRNGSDFSLAPNNVQ